MVPDDADASEHPLYAFERSPGSNTFSSLQTERYTKGHGLMATMEHHLTSTALAGKRLSFIGCGVMAEAIISILIDQEMITRQQVRGGEPIDARRSDLEARFGIEISHDNVAAIEGSDIVLLTIKPQTLETVMRQLAGHLQPHQTVVSIIPGATIERLSEGLQHDRIVRSMPNTPSQIGSGVTAWIPSSSVDEESREAVAAILGTMGTAVQLDSEEAIDMATAISGSGPAYVFMMLEAMIDAGVHLGFPRPVAQQLVEETMLGSILYARQSGKHPAELRNMVTTPGGTTASALKTLEQGGFRTVVNDAVWSAYHRAVELGSGTRNGTSG
jgi:pyrroline-5-carboxylate reductase